MLAPPEQLPRFLTDKIAAQRHVINIPVSTVPYCTAEPVPESSAGQMPGQVHLLTVPIRMS
jgi:hypothetical protein